MKVAVFAGHVGKDSGAVDLAEPAVGDLLCTHETDVTGPIARKVSEYLTQLGIEHALCYGSWETRLDQAADCTVGIDIHADSAPGTRAQGFHVCHYPTAQSKKLAEVLDLTMSYVAIRNRPPHPEPELYVLKRTVFPTVLLECGFLSSVTDEVSLLAEVQQWRIAYAIVGALLVFDTTK